jgi:LysM repeat protein
MPAHPAAPAETTSLAASPEQGSLAAHAEHSAELARSARHETYTVKITDSYKKIAHEHHITVAELKAANHIKGNVLHAGQRLIIPESKSAVARDEASHDFTPAGETVSLTSSGSVHRHLYTVAKGDTLRKIARKFDTTASAIEEANDLPSNKITPGEKLRIPSHDAHSVATASAPDREPSTTAWSAPAVHDVPAPAPAPAYTPAPVSAPSAVAPSQVETQPAPVVQPAPPPQQQPQPSTQSNPALANLTF